MTKNIGIPFEGIPVWVKTSNGETNNVISAVEVFDQRNYSDVSDKGVEKLWAEYHYLDGSGNPYKAVIENREQIKDYVLVANTTNITLYSHISLPKKQLKIAEIKLFDYCNFLGNHEGTVYVDGIYVEKASLLSDMLHILGDDIQRNSIINFIGEKRPILSVDRNTIIDFPDLDDEYLELRDKFISEIKKCSRKSYYSRKIRL